MADEPNDVERLAQALAAEEVQLTPTEVGSALPKFGRELIRVMGFEAALKLIEVHGGQRIEVPTRPGIGNSPRFDALAHLLGERAARQLSSYWGGSEVQVPMMTRVNRLRRVRALIHEYGKGVRVPELARRYQITESTVWKWLKKPV